MSSGAMLRERAKQLNKIDLQKLKVHQGDMHRKRNNKRRQSQGQLVSGIPSKFPFLGKCVGFF